MNLITQKQNKMIELNGLRDRAYKNAVAHGWHEEDKSDQHWLCLVISEIMEAVEADRKNRHASVKFFNHSIDYALRELHLTEQNFSNYFFNSYKENIKGSVEEELADACIRILDLAGLRNTDLDDFDYEGSDTMEYSEMSFTEAMFHISRMATNKFYTGEFIALLLNEIFAFCRDWEIDIFWHIEQKMKYNELRPYKHGNKNY